MGFLTEKQIEQRFIDQRNKDLWERMIYRYRIGVNDDYSFYKLDYQNEMSDVYILTDKEYNKALFTHELLHLELRSVGFNACDGLDKKYLLQPEIELEKFLVGLLYNLLNNIEHIIFSDRFQSLGFKKSEFVADYKTSEYGNPIFGMLVNYSQNPKHNDIYKIMYLSMQITMLSERKIDMDRSQYLQRLASIDHLMYLTGEIFYKAIEILDPYRNEKAQEDLNRLIGIYITPYLK